MGIEHWNRGPGGKSSHGVSSSPRCCQGAGQANHMVGVACDFRTLAFQSHPPEGFVVDHF